MLGSGKTNGPKATFSDDGLARADTTENVVIPHNYLLWLTSIIMREQSLMLSELDGRQRIPKLL
jgi:hypothetical protein